jgi:hypothetical protein
MKSSSGVSLFSGRLTSRRMASMHSSHPKNKLMRSLHNELDALLCQTLDGEIFVFFIGGVQHHAAYSFLKLINVIQKDFKVGGIQFHVQLMVYGWI